MRGGSCKGQGEVPTRGTTYYPHIHCPRRWRDAGCFCWRHCTHVTKLRRGLVLDSVCSAGRAVLGLSVPCSRLTKATQPASEAALILGAKAPAHGVMCNEHKHARAR
jgi:hypothetical protein